MEYISIKIIKIKQNIGSFFIGKMTPRDLHRVANKNLERAKNIEEGIQRALREKRIKEIKEYIKTKDSTFPNTIILSIQENPANETAHNYILDEENNEIMIRIADNVVNVLDGQHRLAGFSNEEIDYELPVSIFLDLSLGEQAKIFAKINSTQKKVELDLVYELFGITEGKSPEKSAYYIVKHLNDEPNSAWFNKIKTLTDRSGDLAQGSMAKYIHVELIENDKIFNKLYKEERDTDMKKYIEQLF